MAFPGSVKLTSSRLHRVTLIMTIPRTVSFHMNRELTVPLLYYTTTSSCHYLNILFILPSVHLPDFLSVCLSSTYPSTMSVYLCLLINLSNIHQSIYLLYPSIYQSIYTSSIHNVLTMVTELICQVIQRHCYSR